MVISKKNVTGHLRMCTFSFILLHRLGLRTFSCCSIESSLELSLLTLEYSNGDMAR